ncbi:hypothetical protein [Modestobacter versicolor]|uniref:hypothetical protein n=1 Tax=Modestobacter versicolor TaxID=429133 RepID=UPI0034DE2B65
MSRRDGAPEAGGPLVALCVGHRCAALRRLAGAGDGVEQVAAAVRRTSGAVLVTAGCLGGCDRAALAGLARRSPGIGAPGPVLWLSEMQTAERTGALVQWVEAGAPAAADDGTGQPAVAELPACLRTAVTGVGPPVRTTRAQPSER